MTKYEVTFTAANDNRKRKRQLEGILSVAADGKAHLEVGAKIIRFRNSAGSLSVGSDLKLDGYDITIDGIIQTSGTAPQVAPSQEAAQKSLATTTSKPPSFYSKTFSVPKGQQNKSTTGQGLVPPAISSGNSSALSSGRSDKGLYISSTILRKLRVHQIVGANFILRAIQGHSKRDDERVSKENPEGRGVGIFAETRSDGLELRYYEEARVPATPTYTTGHHKVENRDSDFESDGEDGEDGEESGVRKVLGRAGGDAVLSGRGTVETESDSDDDKYRTAEGKEYDGKSSESSDDAFFSELARSSHSPSSIDAIAASASVLDERASLNRGCILADEMGLGKTHQALAVVAAVTAAKVAPHDANRTCCKAVVVCPATLIDNWVKEISKVFGSFYRPVVLRGFTTTSDKEALKSFAINKVPLLVTSYETFRKAGNDINKVKYLELLVCDEGHRLKSSSGNQTISALSKCKATRRLVLTGTPVQNDLDELYALVSFVCPGYLGSLAAYRREYTSVIERGQTPGAPYDDVSEANTVSKRLRARLANIMIHRTQDEVLRNVLPPRRDYIVYTSLSQEQIRQYDHVSAQMFASIGATDPGGPGARGEAQEDLRGVQASSAVLPCLQKLRAICTHALTDGSVMEEYESDQDEEARETALIPASHKVQKVLLNQPQGEGAEEDDIDCNYDTGKLAPTLDRNQTTTKSPSGSNFKPHAATVHVKATPSSLSQRNNDCCCGGNDIGALSVKLSLLVRFLAGLQEQSPQDKVVIISNFASVLARVAELAQQHGWGQLTLTGKTPPRDRQHLVDRFNRSTDKTFLFLLSSKAGGTGLNLIGANRLISLDPDWNPAVDKQAMARVWRQGQKKPVFVYRFQVRNSIESAILSRQHAKGLMSDNIMTTKAQAPKATGYSRKDLIQLIRPHLVESAEAVAKSSEIEDCADTVMASLAEQLGQQPLPSRHLIGLNEVCP